MRKEFLKVLGSHLLRHLEHDSQPALFFKKRKKVLDNKTLTWHASHWITVNKQISSSLWPNIVLPNSLSFLPSTKWTVCGDPDYIVVICIQQLHMHFYFISVYWHKLIMS